MSSFTPLWSPASVTDLDASEFSSGTSSVGAALISDGSGGTAWALPSAEKVTVTPTETIESTNVQDALAELSAEQSIVFSVMTPFIATQLGAL